jgi:hypothetical protein
MTGLHPNPSSVYCNASDVAVGSEGTRVRRAVLVAFPAHGGVIPYLGGCQARPLGSEEGVAMFDPWERRVNGLESQYNQ